MAAALEPSATTKCAFTCRSMTMPMQKRSSRRTAAWPRSATQTRVAARATTCASCSMRYALQSLRALFLPSLFSMSLQRETYTRVAARATASASSSPCFSSTGLFNWSSFSSLPPAPCRASGAINVLAPRQMAGMAYECLSDPHCRAACHKQPCNVGAACWTHQFEPRLRVCTRTSASAIRTAAPHTTSSCATWAQCIACNKQLAVYGMRALHTSVQTASKRCAGV